MPGGPDGAADALQRLDLDASAGAEDAPLPEASTPPPLPSVSAAVGGGLEEEGLRRLQELAGIGRDKVELTEEEVRANDLRQEDEVMPFSHAIRELFSRLGSKRKIAPRCIN
jgi:E3 ubiquitin-protein ligase RNF14